MTVWVCVCMCVLLVCCIECRFLFCLCMCMCCCAYMRACHTCYMDCCCCFCVRCFIQRDITHRSDCHRTHQIDMHNNKVNPINFVVDKSGRIIGNFTDFSRKKNPAETNKEICVNDQVGTLTSHTVSFCVDFCLIKTERQKDRKTVREGLWTLRYLIVKTFLSKSQHNNIRFFLHRFYFLQQSQQQ